MKRLDPRSVIIGFLIAVIGFMSMGATNTTFDSITVGEIILKNESLVIKTPQGGKIVKLSDNEGNGELVLGNSKGIPTIALTHTVDGDGTLQLYNSSGQMKIRLTHSPGGGAIDIYNGSGDKSIDLGNSRFGGGLFRLYNKYNHDTVFITSNKEGDGFIQLSDRYGDGQWAMTGKR